MINTKSMHHTKIFDSIRGMLHNRKPENLFSAAHTRYMKKLWLKNIPYLCLFLAPSSWVDSLFVSIWSLYHFLEEKKNKYELLDCLYVLYVASVGISIKKSLSLHILYIFPVWRPQVLIALSKTFSAFLLSALKRHLSWHACVLACVRTYVYIPPIHISERVCLPHRGREKEKKMPPYIS